MKAILPAALAVALLACGGNEAVKPLPPGELQADYAAGTAQLHALRGEITALVGEARCNADGDCRALPLGAKPCGGPWEYLIYSAAETDPAQLEAKVRGHNALESMLNRLGMRGSNCAYEMPPARLACRENRCVNPAADAPLRKGEKQ